VLEGSVRMVGNEVRIVVQLISAEDGYNLWSNKYNRQLSNIFVVQEEIATAVVGALQIALLSDAEINLASRPTQSLEAFDLYLLGRFHFHKRNSASLHKAVEFFEQAIELDEGYALAYSGLADTYVFLTYYGGMTAEKAGERAEPLLMRALELDDGLAEVYASLGLLWHRLGRYAEAEEALARSTEINPNYANAHIWTGLNFVRQSRLEEATAAYLRAQALDPLHPTLNFNAGANLMLMGRFEEGMDSFRRDLEAYPEKAITTATIASWMGSYGKLVEAVKWGRRAVLEQPERPSILVTLGSAYTNLGMWDEAWSVISWARQLAPDHHTAKYIVVDFYFGKGDLEAFKEFAHEEIDKAKPGKGDELTPLDRYRVEWFAIAQLLDAEYHEAVESLLRNMGGISGIENVVYDHMEPLKYLASAYQGLNRREEANKLLTQCLDLVSAANEQGWDTPALHYRLAQVYALQGDADSAIASLNQAMEKGWRIYGALDHDPLWNNLKDDPEFQRIKARVHADIRDQRDQLWEMEASGELEPIPELVSQ